MDLFTYLMAKKGKNTGRDLFSYLLGKNAGGSGTYTTFSGISLNISNTIFGNIKNFMLNSTELTQDGTPTPSSPVDVNVIKGDNNVKVENKNLSVKDTTTNPDANYTSSGQGTSVIQYSQDEEGFYTTTHRARIYENLEVGKSYTISLLGKLRSEGSNNYPATVYFYNTKTQALSGSQGSVVNKSVLTNEYVRYSRTYTLTSGYDAIRIFFYSSLYFKDIQLEIGQSATEYVEHQEQNYPISLGTLEYCKIGNYADQIFKNTTDSPYYDNTLIENEWYLKKNIGKVVLNGSENWTTEVQGGYNNYRTGIPSALGKDTSVSCMSNYFVGVSGNDSYQGPVDNAIGIGSSRNLRIRRTTFADVNEFKTWLSTHNTNVYYFLTTPTYIHITQEDYPTLKGQLEDIYNNAKSYNEQTNITQTNDDLPFNISVDVLVGDE